MLTISGYAPCPNITKVVTPDIKHPGQSTIYFLDLGAGHDRIGASGKVLTFIHF